jgi:hypothetical protein
LTKPSIFRYFHLDSQSEEPIKLQKGIIRTNCMDNLDRTNVTQAAFARWNLDMQLRVLGVLNERDSIAQHGDIDSVFRICEYLFFIVNILHASISGFSLDFTS